jgi:CBS domain containing-hemolysin-like protein
MISLLLLFFSVAIVTSFLCSLWEAVLLSITPSYAQIQLQKGTQLGRRLQAFKEDIDRPLAAILTLNTIAHTVGAIGVGDQAAKIWADAHPLITGLLVPAVMTLAILVLSELIPKTLGANYWQQLAPLTARSLTWLVRLLGPLGMV